MIVPPAGRLAEKSGKREDPNQPVYNKSQVAEHYAALNYLTHCERSLSDTYLRLGMSILDLGVGGGCTTA